MATPTAGLTIAPTRERLPEEHRAIEFGFWAAGLTAAVTAVFAVVAVATPARSGPFCASACVPAPYIAVGQFIPGDALIGLGGALVGALATLGGAWLSGHSLREQQRRDAMVALERAARGPAY